MSKLVRRRDIDGYLRRFPTLVEFGMLDEEIATKLAGADKLGCRPCDVVIVSSGPKASLVEWRL